MTEFSEQFRRDVVTSAESYLGAPPTALNISKFNQSTIELGTTPETGFNCSGLVLRSICDAFGDVRLADVCHPEYRRSIDLVGNLGGPDDLPRLSYREVRPGDVIARVDDKYPTYGGPHLLLATGELEQGKVPFIHAARTIMYTSGVVAESGVMRGNLRSRPRQDFLHIPLGLLVEKAFTLDMQNDY